MIEPMLFFRIVDNVLYKAGDVDILGFEESEGLRIPDEYLDNRTFVIMRMCLGIGDWGVVSAMPRLLKMKYPDCKVYVPTAELQEKICGDIGEEWNSWNNPFENGVNVFRNNPYIDGFADSVGGEIFHDHYRVYNKDNPNIPMLEQMLKFWQFEEDECRDSAPEVYFSGEERELGNKIIKEYVGEGEYGCLLLSDRYDYTMDKSMLDVIDSNLKHFYWTEKPIEQTSFNNINVVLDMRHMPIRIQLYIRCKAKYNVGNQCGTTQLVSRYSKVYTVQRQFPIAHNFVRGEVYLNGENI
jgi:hypothetical protein